MTTTNPVSNLNPFHFLKYIRIVFKAQIVPAAVAKHPYERWFAPRNYSFIAIIIAVVFFTSCKKENIAGTVLNSATAGNSSAKAQTVGGGPSPNTSYGAFIRPPAKADDLSYQLNVADQLGIGYLREAVVVPSSGTDLVPELNTKYKVLLNFSSTGSGEHKRVPFRTDLKRYKNDLNNILNTFTVMPVVAVIENEESNRFFYSGTASQYINQLSAAISVMHARSIKVSNGAITRPGLNYLVYQDFLAQGKTDSAKRFKRLAHVTTDTATQHRSLFIDTLLTNYAQMNLDYVNFHWKDSVTNTDAINEVINYLVKRTGKTIITNELGQFDQDPNTLTALVQRCTDRNFPFIIWYSPSESYKEKGYPLQHDDGTLTPTGIAYRDYLAN